MWCGLLVLLQFLPWTTSCSGGPLARMILSHKMSTKSGSWWWNEQTLAGRGWKTSFHYKLVIFRVYVNFPEGTKGWCDQVNRLGLLFFGVTLATGVPWSCTRDSFCAVKWWDLQNSQAGPKRYLYGGFLKWKVPLNHPFEWDFPL